jgi:hypothetical protein
MSALPRCLLIVTAEVDPAIEAEWSRWYDDVHLPDALACPGVLAGRRYVTAGDVSESVRGERRAAPRKIYTTVYELAGPAAVRSKEFQAMRGWYQFSPHVVSRTMVVEAL